VFRREDRAELRRVARAAEAAHHEVVPRGVVHPVRRTEPRPCVVEGTAAEDTLAFGRDWVRPGVPLLVAVAELRQGLERVVAVADRALRGPGPLVRVRIVRVFDPLPDVACEIVMPVWAVAERMRPHVGRDARFEYGMLLRRLGVAPRIPSP